MEQERRGFDEMEALAMASMFWRRSRHTNSKMDTRHSIGVTQTDIRVLSPLPSLCSDAVWHPLLLSFAAWSVLGCWTSLASPLAVVSSRRPPYPYISLSSVVIVSPLTEPACELRVYLSSDPWISIRLAFRQTALLLSTPPVYTLCHHRLPILLHQVHLRH
jgi:hypothetical protein